ncbi:OLC1v1014650C2 [Oldenlandia corymbosa var. corymbosa]|uniref:OLC1v1014650C2 n=1 Tax=Oldenlandia corymbosa var. corymbosa TaxID=529605 RepID=A0AAV1E3M8_OLDCO|nr:OLC1v1014650C2 [Oldenlandia corymbosa var. corymbosa]
MNYRFHNLLGAPYRGGNAVMVDDNLVSPVGNRVSVTDLKRSETVTLPCQTSANIRRLAASPDGVFLLAIDDNNRCLFINLRRRVVLHRISFKHPVATAKFSPDGKFIAVAAGKLLQIWRSPGFRKEFFPFELIRTFADCNDKITALEWSPDSNYILVGSKDLAVRLFSMKKRKDNRKTFKFLGHRDTIVGCFFGIDHRTKKVTNVYTVSRDGALLRWGYSGDYNNIIGDQLHNSEPESPGTPDQGVEPNGEGDITQTMLKKRKDFDGKDEILGEGNEVLLDNLKWELLKKDYFMQAPAKLTACDYHQGRDMLLVAFSNGVFGLYQLPNFVCSQMLSISREKITTAIFNDRGDWLVFGCAKLSQLSVWAFESDTYILKQQGHYFDVNCIAYSPDSQFLATGADDHKVKVWNVSMGFCFYTSSVHTDAVTALHFMANNHCLLSASLDGTVRALDFFRYRNFRTFTTPTSKQFVSLAADQSGEVICAGTLDSFEIYVWSMKTGRLLDVLSGHEGPVHGLMFSPTTGVLSSSSWDKTVRLWDVFEGKGAVETFAHTHDVLTVVYRPDGKQLACSTLDGSIHFWDPFEGLLMHTIEGRRDIAGGRLMTDRRSAANSTIGKYFTTLCYSADGSYILAGGNSKYICMYDIADQVLLRRFQITHNLSLDGVLDFLNSKNMTEAGPIDLIDDDNSDAEEGVERQTQGKLAYDLPGSMPNRGRPVIRTKCLRIAPTGRTWAAATTEGVLIYSMDDSFIFDPTDLDIDVTPEVRTLKYHCSFVVIEVIDSCLSSGFSF